MRDSNVWSVDRLAATNLCAGLGLQLGEAQMALVAEHFATHRRDAQGWAAERVQANILQKLESASQDLLARRCEQWSDGFRSAEQVMLTLSPEELLGLEPDRARTKGQVLRMLMRQARRNGAAAQ